MSPKLKPLLLPQLVEERKQTDDHTILEDSLPFTSHTTNSSSSDIVSPITPTFSTRGHFRGSSSTSSLDLVHHMPMQDGPASPTQPLSKKPSMRQLPDVEEEPLDREEDRTIVSDSFGLYSCLCDEPCEHRTVAESRFSGDGSPEYDFEYDLGCLSDEDSSIYRQSQKSDAVDSPFHGLSTRISSRFNTMNRLKPSRKTSLMSSPTIDTSFENIISRVSSSRSSSLSSPYQHMPDRSWELPSLATPSMSCYDSVGSFDSLGDFDEDFLGAERTKSLERDRAKAVTPLLPPSMTEYFSKPPCDSPLQSPTIESSATIAPQAPLAPNFSRPSLSTRPSMTSLRQVPTCLELPLPLSLSMQEHDEWSDRLGHANFTITPQPYELGKVDSETITRFRDDWELARINYTKHLVRTGENYGQTSKIYGLTEAKWAETEGRWKAIYEGAIKQTSAIIPNSHSYTLRARSRGRGRGRSGSASASIMGRPANDDFFAEMQWQRIEDSLPSAVPRMLDAEGKFPARGDEDIVGPMHRAETMARSQSEEKHGARFWKSLADKVRLLK